MNELIHSFSPYLLQHAHNPVHWREWSESVFDEAKRLNRPVLISIGYSTCHWCHVMEKESFEDIFTAEYMNANFICVKIDREELPHVDKFYMDAVMSMNQQGGWPLNVFVSPDKKPFYGGTYFSPQPMYNKPSWRQVLEAIHNAWNNDHQALLDQGEQIAEHLQQMQPNSASDDKNITKALDQGWYQSAFLSNFDQTYGGWYSAPKFPQFLLLNNLVKHYSNTKEEVSLTAIKTFWSGILDNGLWDSVEGGLYRYAVDREWHIPHFEKMLYDNALLIEALCMSIEHCDMVELKDILIRQMNFLLSKMTNDKGLFVTAFDADSEGIEGYYYVLSEEEYDDFSKQLFDQNAFSVRILYHEDLRYYKVGLNELFIVKNNAEEEKIVNYLYEVRREKRLFPFIDFKAILSLNALANKALLSAYKILFQESILAFAENHFLAMQNHFLDEKKYFKINYGDRQVEAQSDDLVQLIDSAIELYTLTGKEPYKKIAKITLNNLQDNFVDENTSLLNLKSLLSNDIPIAIKDVQDNIIPSSNSVYVSILLKLGLIESRTDWIGLANRIIGSQYKQMLQFPQAHANWWLTYEWVQNPSIFKVNKPFNDFFYQKIKEKLGSKSYFQWSLRENEHDYNIGEIIIQQCFEDRCTLFFKGDVSQFEK